MNDASNESPLSPSGKQQIVLPRRLMVANFSGVGSDAQQDVLLRMRLPDSRLVAKFTLRAAQSSAPPALVLAGRGLTLWLYEEEADQANGGRYAPCTDLAGSTSAAPINLPANAALGGFSREFVTSADAIGARVRIPAQAPGGTAGQLYFQARFQPHVGRYMPPEEWNYIAAKLQDSIELLTDAGAA